MRATPALKHCSRQSSSQHAARRCELPSRLDPSLVHDGFELAEAADRSASPAVARERSVDCHWQRAHAEGRGWTLWSAVALPCPVRSSYPRPNLYPRRMSALLCRALRQSCRLVQVPCATAPATPRCARYAGAQPPVRRTSPQMGRGAPCVSSRAHERRSCGRRGPFKRGQPAATTDSWQRAAAIDLRAEHIRYR